MVTGHSRVPQVAHQGVDGNCGVVILATGNQTGSWEQIPSILAVPCDGPCKQNSKLDQSGVPGQVFRWVVAGERGGGGVLGSGGGGGCVTSFLS